MMTSNIEECINGCLVDARQLRIIDFLKEARILFGIWNCKNREMTSYTKEILWRRFEEILIINTSKCAKMKVHICITSIMFLALLLIILLCIPNQNSFNVSLIFKHLLVVASSEYIFAVYEGGIRYIVCLERKTCSCGRF